MICQKISRGFFPLIGLMKKTIYFLHSLMVISDLIEYNTRYRGIKRITEDYHDDLNASVVQLGSQVGILFSSNRLNEEIVSERMDTILPLNDFDIYFLPRSNDGYASSAVNLSPNSEDNDIQPVLANDHYIVYLNEKSGIYNRYLTSILIPIEPLQIQTMNTI